MAISFQDAVRDLINRHCMENGSDTPDHILATYLCNCLASYEVAVCAREKWYGREIHARSALPETVKFPGDPA